MGNLINRQLAKAAGRIVRPLIRIMLRNGFSCREFSDLIRRVFVDVALNEFSLDDGRTTTSRISVLTGLSRKEVARLRKEYADEEDVVPLVNQVNRAARVVSAWIREPDYLGFGREPLSLPMEGQGSFFELVQRFGGDVPAKAVLDELLRTETVAFDDDGRVSLIERGYMPGRDSKLSLDIMGRDVSDLIQTIDHNMRSDPDRRFFQRKVLYDNLPHESIDAIRTRVAKDSQRLLEELDMHMSSQDRDVHPNIQGTGRKRVMTGIYYYEEDVEKNFNDEERKDVS